MYVIFCVLVSSMDVCLDLISFLGYGQLLVLGESLTVLLVLADIVEIACG